MESIEISSITVGERHRRDPGDLELLAQSIQEKGLLHPIVVTPDKRLVAGWRRLQACRDILGWEEIPARVIDECPSDIGELHENEARKDLTDFELNELADKLRKDSLPHGGGGRFFENLLSKRDAAKAVGLGTGKKHRIDLVKSRGIPELIAWMESDEGTISSAAEIAKQPEARQREIMALPAHAREEEVRRLREEPAPVNSRPQQGPSVKRRTRQVKQWAAALAKDLAAEEIPCSAADDAESRAAIAQLREILDAYEAKRSPDPKPKRRRRKRKPDKEPRCKPRMSEESLNKRWARLSDEQRQVCQTKAAVVATAEQLHKRDGLPRKRAYVSAAAGCPDLTVTGETLYQAFLGRKNEAGLRWYPLHQWAMVLAKKHEGGGKEAECDPAAWDAFKTAYLRSEQPTLEQCYRDLQRLAEREGWKIPSAKALKRKLEREVHPSAIVLAREGAEALSKRRPPQIREKPDRAMEMVNGDARKSDVFVKWPDGEIARPWLHGWQDIGFSKVLSWRIDKSENASGYRLAFADLLRDYGIPQHVYMDNSRAFAAKGLTGGAKSRFRFKLKADDPVGLLTQLVGPEGIHWTTPYHGQSKPIERTFRDIASDIDKDHRLRGAFTGNNPDAKPENYGSKAIPLEKFVRVVADRIAQHNARRGRRGLGMDGRSFDEAFQESHARHSDSIARPTESQLARWLLGAEGVTAHKESGAVILHGTRYWSERLAEKLAGRSAAERRVVLRFDPDHLDRPVTVETLDGRLIATAAVQGAVKYRDIRAARETARDKAKLRRHGREQLKIHKTMSDREYEQLLDEVDAEEREAEAPPARSKVVAGAFGREPSSSRPKQPEREEKAAEEMRTGTDNLIRMMTDQAFPRIDDEED